MNEFIGYFTTEEGNLIARTSVECMDYLENTLGWSVASAKGILGQAVMRGYVSVLSTTPIKTYGL